MIERQEGQECETINFLATHNGLPSSGSYPQCQSKLFLVPYPKLEGCPSINPPGKGFFALSFILFK